MRTMGDPDYEYRPWSEERKAEAKARQQARFAPPGFRNIYGIDVPEEHHALIVKIARKLRNPSRNDDARASLNQVREVVRGLLAALG